MRLAIDATRLKEGALTGVERYTITLIRNLLQLNIQDQVYLLFNGPVHSSLADLQGRFTPLIWPLAAPALRFVREQFWMPWVLRQARVDVAHFTFYPPPLLCPCPVVLTLHDPGLYLFPHLMAPMVNYYHKPLIWSGLRRGMIKRIVTPSHTARLDSLRCMAIPETMIHAVYPGLDWMKHVSASQPNLVEVRQKYGISGPYLLTVGMYMPLKNIPTLLQAFARLRDCYPDLSLVIVGRPGWDRRVPLTAPPPGVIFTGYVPNDELKSLFAGADLFVFPTLYEGFGLPILEAMHYGLPVVCSDIPVLREIYGPAAIFANPHAPDDFASKIEMVLKDRARREECISAGNARAAALSDGRNFASQLHAIYTEVVENV